MARWQGKTGTVRLDGEDIRALREACFDRDNGRCIDCGERVYLEGSWPRRMEMAHVTGRGASGSDTLENVRAKCGIHHHYEHNGGRKVVPAKVQA